MAEKNEEQEARTWANFPWAKTIIVLLSSIGVLFGIVIQRYNASDKIRQEQITEALKANVVLNAKIDELYKQLNECKDDRVRFFQKQDSTNRAALERPAKDLLNALKK